LFRFPLYTMPFVFLLIIRGGARLSYIMQN